MKTCLNCDKEITDKQKYCSDKCRMSYTRRTKQGDLPEQTEPEQARTLDFSPTRTDRLFEDFNPNYYRFSTQEYSEKCLDCSKAFKSHLKLLRFCSPTCQLHALDSLTGKFGK